MTSQYHTSGTSHDQDNAITREEAKRILRKLELDAYSAVVSAFRAQGDINRSKKLLLDQLGNNLSISTERHRAELRRAVSDERLAAVASCFNGSSTEWSKEGKRLVSLMPRLVPQTVFTAKATIAANKTVEKNQKLPLKSDIEVHPIAAKQKKLTSTSSLNTPTERKNMKLHHSISQDSPLLLLEEKRKKRKLSTGSSKAYTLVSSRPPTASPKYNLLPPSNKIMPTSEGASFNTPHFLSKSLTGSFTSFKSTNQALASLQRNPNATVLKPGSLNVSLLNNLGNLKTPGITQNKINKIPGITQNRIDKTPGIAQNRTDKTQDNTQNRIDKLLSNTQNRVDGVKLSPLLKVVSTPTSLFETISVSTPNHMTQKFKFKSPVQPPTKLKATKSKQIIPVQKSPILLATEQVTENINNDVTSSVANSVCKSVITSHNNVKVVQIARGSNTTSLSMNDNSMNSTMKTTPSSGVIPVIKTELSRVPNQLSILSCNSFQMSEGMTSSGLTKTTICTGKSLATGFKMIAVTTMIPGTTQIKTVYIATPIMSANKLSLLNNVSTIPVPIPKPPTTGTAHTEMKTFNNISKTLRTATLLPLKTSVVNSSFPSLTLTKPLKVNASRPASLFKTVASTSTTTTQNVKIVSCTLKDKMNSNSNHVTSKTSSNQPVIINSKQPLLRPIGTPLNLKHEPDHRTMRSSNYVISVYNKNTPFPTSVLNSLTSTTLINSTMVSFNTTPVNTTKVTVSSSPRPDDFKAVWNLLNNADTSKKESSSTAGTVASFTAGTVATAIASPDNLAFLTENEKFLEQLSMKLSGVSTIIPTLNSSISSVNSSISSCKASLFGSVPVVSSMSIGISKINKSTQQKILPNDSKIAMTASPSNSTTTVAITCSAANSTAGESNVDIQTKTTATAASNAVTFKREPVDSFPVNSNLPAVNTVNSNLPAVNTVNSNLPAVNTGTDFSSARFSLKATSFLSGSSAVAIKSSSGSSPVAVKSSSGSSPVAVKSSSGASSFAIKSPVNVSYPSLATNKTLSNLSFTVQSNKSATPLNKSNTIASKSSTVTSNKSSFHQTSKLSKLNIGVPVSSNSPVTMATSTAYSIQNTTLNMSNLAMNSQNTASVTQNTASVTQNITHVTQNTTNVMQNTAHVAYSNIPSTIALSTSNLHEEFFKKSLTQQTNSFLNNLLHIDDKKLDQEATPSSVSVNTTTPSSVSVNTTTKLKSPQRLAQSQIKALKSPQKPQQPHLKTRFSPAKIYSVNTVSNGEIESQVATTCNNFSQNIQLQNTTSLSKKPLSSLQSETNVSFSKKPPSKLQVNASKPGTSNNSFPQVKVSSVSVKDIKMHKSVSVANGNSLTSPDHVLTNQIQPSFAPANQKLQPSLSSANKRLFPSTSVTDQNLQIVLPSNILNSSVSVSSKQLGMASTSPSSKQNFSDTPNTAPLSNNLVASDTTPSSNDISDVPSRKRKLKELNDSTPGFIAPIYGRTQASWIRGATNLLQRVSRFRGTNKQKGEMNAASWFTKPVDPNEEPGYYHIIKTPMDFGKIRRKLEEGEYVSYPHFYEDMMQIKRNCYIYNPEGHIVRKDCDDVFSFFESEYEKLLMRWEKRIYSPQKKPRLTSDSS